MNKCGCGCKAVLSLNTKPNSVIQIKDRDEPFLNMNTKDKGVDATINGVNTLTLTAEGGLELVQEGDVATITGQPLKDEISGVASDLGEEITNRQNADSNLQNQIDSISGDLSNYRKSAQQDVIDNRQDEEISGKQNQLNQLQLDAVNSGINATKVSAYDNHIANTTIHVTTQEKINWNNKQNAIQDLDIIRSNALAGKNASNTISGYGDIVTHDVSEFATSEQGDLADTALQPTDVIDNTSSNDTDKPLSANMGKSLQDQVDNLKARGRFLALWNCATGLAETNPPSGTYTYQAGDYFIVGIVAQSGGTNYKPDGATYTTGVASTVVETQPVDTDDVYYYDGHVWHLQVNTQKEIGFVNIAGDPYDNTALASALNEKQNEIDDLDEIRSGASAGATALQPSALNGYATEQWVGQQGFLTSTALNGYATQTWVGQQGYLTGITSTDVINALGYTPYSSSNPSGYITSSALNNYVTLNTLQTITSGKKIFANDAVMAGNQTALLATISNSSTYTTDNAWVGRYICGAKNLTFLMGTYRTMAGIGAHSWTNAQTGSGASWADFYLNPDGSNAVYIGGNLWTKNSGWMKIKNSGNTNGTVQVNRNSISSPSWKNVACWGDNISNFVNNSGYLTSTALSNYVTLNTNQTMTAAKAIFGDDVAFGTDTSQKNLFAIISNDNSKDSNWVGRLTVGAKDKTFVMGTYARICVLGAHSWTNAQQGTGAAWEDIYINPDGDKTVYIGGSPINNKKALMKISNINANTTGTVKINRSNNLTDNFKDVACWDDNVSKFNNDAGYITSSALNGYATEQYVDDIVGDIESTINAIRGV